jgi:hypothetical protein
MQPKKEKGGMGHGGGPICFFWGGLLMKVIDSILLGLNLEIHNIK